jgi:hypothetical protein
MKKLRVFVSAPGDIHEERQIVKEGIALLNKLQHRIGIQIEVIDFETDIPSHFGNSPQKLIDNYIGEYDFYVGIMWNRFGTPTKEAGSGTEHEFNKAYESRVSRGRPDLMFFFKTLPFYPGNIQEIEEFRKVLEFKDRIKQLGIYKEYGSADQFRTIFTSNFYQRIDKLTVSKSMTSSP